MASSQVVLETLELLKTMIPNSILELPEWKQIELDSLKTEDIYTQELVRAGIAYNWVVEANFRAGEWNKKVQERKRLALPVTSESLKCEHHDFYLVEMKMFDFLDRLIKCKVAV